jgi:hypothetical protein
VQWTIAEGGNGHWYEVILGSYTWQEASDSATSVGGHLATLTSAEENEWVWELTVPDGNGPHIGGYQDLEAPDYSEPSGGWRWVTGEEWSYTNWSSNQPDDTAGVEHWLHLHGEATSSWNDLVTAQRNFIIEWSD